ncbi:hypothetical protein S7711_01060 [Stachybotrys chartarum IBT 7711]|uniref:Terpene synthase n=1 Tax=Stachybotrys chartarum (strain CBS 109288 / IBT 7711) TaxID=1280523 RepID=A0A084B4B2_STACB|nr:hypothetical protein S7711_01060 [Stachybotrys chartarum IBT 7711]KFA54327.1 hypothetical protein S40293_04815 [Stachybotrys chartarum IBT 40293]
MKYFYSSPTNVARLGLLGFCQGYTSRVHKYEGLANAGSHEARNDWQTHIAPVKEFGGCNPLNGNFTALVLPLCRPDRLQTVAYCLEYAFLHDNVVETIDMTYQKQGSDEFTLGLGKSNAESVEAGRKKLQAKLMLRLHSIDAQCAERVTQFRRVDTGAPFVESMMLFGMGMTLDTQEDELMAPILKPCYSALALANDYFSFDREHEESQRSGSQEILNAVMLFMRLHKVDVSAAKRLVKQACNRYEHDFLHLCHEFRTTSSCVTRKLDVYLDAMSYQVAGNVIWSLNCPRYHPSFRYDANAGVEDQMALQHRNLTTPIGTCDEKYSVASNDNRDSVTSIGSASTDSTLLYLALGGRELEDAAQWT